MKTLGGEQKGALDAQSGIIVLFVLCAIVSGFWYVWQRQKDSKNMSQKVIKTVQSKVAPAKPAADDQQPQRYHDPEGQFTVSYPGAWQINQTYTGSGSESIHSATLTSPSGSTKMYIIFQRSYIETDCIADYYDVPFASTNRCFSAEFLTAEDINAQSNRNSLYLTHYHYKTITINAKEAYNSCLLIGQPAINKPKMGFFIDHPVSRLLAEDGSEKGYLSACVDAGTTPADYNKPEVQAAESILRSLRFDN